MNSVRNVLRIFRVDPENFVQVGVVGCIFTAFGFVVAKKVVIPTFEAVSGEKPYGLGQQTDLDAGKAMSSRVVKVDKQVADKLASVAKPE